MIPKMTETELIRWFSSELTRYKTTSSKKAYLTRCKKDADIYVNELLAQREAKRPYLYGEPVTFMRIADAKREARVIEAFQKLLS